MSRGGPSFYHDRLPGAFYSVGLSKVHVILRGLALEGTHTVNFTTLMNRLCGEARWDLVSRFSVDTSLRFRPVSSPYRLHSQFFTQFSLVCCRFLSLSNTPPPCFQFENIKSATVLWFRITMTARTTTIIHRCLFGVHLKEACRIPAANFVW